MRKSVREARQQKKEDRDVYESKLTGTLTPEQVDPANIHKDSPRSIRRNWGSGYLSDMPATPKTLNRDAAKGDSGDGKVSGEEHSSFLSQGYADDDGIPVETDLAAVDFVQPGDGVGGGSLQLVEMEAQEGKV